MIHVPSRGQWQARPPAEVGMRADAVQAAIFHHRAHESGWPRDFITLSGRFIGVADEPADSAVLGPVPAPRKDPSGLVVRHGHIVAEWGDTARTDMSFSIAKSYLAVAGRRGGAARSDRRHRRAAGPDAIDDGFASPQNGRITWRHLLQQTSEWQGTLWDKPDPIDHNRDVGKSELGHAAKGTPRPLRAPGTVWEYNDVRVNRLSLSPPAALPAPAPRRAAPDHHGSNRCGRRLGVASVPQLLGRAGRDSACPRCPAARTGAAGSGCPRAITRASACSCCGGAPGASSGCSTRPGSTRCGSRAPSTRSTDFSGGSTPGAPRCRSAPASSYAARGAGSNVIWIDPEHDLVIVLRWIDKGSVDGFLKLILEGLAG